MKICFLSYRSNPYCGGQGVYVYHLTRGLSRLGHEVHVMSGPPYPRVAEGVELHKLESLNLYESFDSFPANFPRRPTPINLYEYMAVWAGTFPEPLTFSIRAYRKLKELQRHHKFDIVHDNQCLGYGLLLMKRLKLPVVATIHHPIPIDRKIDLAYAKSLREKFKLMRWYSFCNMQSLVSRRVDRVINVSQSSAEETRRIFKVSPSKTRVVYNGIDGDLFTRDSSVPKEPNSLIMTNSGNWRMKGLLYLLKALQQLKGETAVKLTIVGGGMPDGQEIRLVEECELGDIVTFTGKIDAQELVRRYSASEIAIVPSVYEGFGLPAAEAMSCKVPIIAARGGALPEVVGENGEAGILVPTADPDALAAAIKHLLSAEPVRRNMGEAGRKRVASNFTWEQAARSTLEVYEELL